MTRLKIRKKLLSTLKRNNVQNFRDQKSHHRLEYDKKRMACHIGDCIENIPAVMRSKHPGGVMVLSVVFKGGARGALYFIEPG